MKIERLIEKYESELVYYKDGGLCSTGEMVHGKVWCEKILRDLKEVKHTSDKIQEDTQGEDNAYDEATERSRDSG